jgi:hypothetical protein
MKDVDVISDLTGYDTIKGYSKFLCMIIKTYFDFVLLLKARYNNYLSVGYKWKKKQFPIIAVLRNGTQKRLSSQEEIWFDIRNIAYDKEKDIVTIGGLKFRGGTTKGDIINIFVNNEYEFLPLIGRIVVDIGANIADSSLYFIRQGAKKVYAFEPDRALYELAIENVSLNSMSDRIETIFAGCSSNPSSGSYPPFLSLKEMVESYKIAPDLLKIDCEGCEYDVILSTSCEVLKSFNDIIVEYHYGFRRIKKKLEKCGFTTKVWGPTFYPQSNKSNAQNTRFSNKPTKVETDSLVKPFIGYIYATKSSTSR